MKNPAHHLKQKNVIRTFLLFGFLLSAFMFKGEVSGSTSSTEDTQTPLTNSPAYFEQQVHPILQKHCFECHGSEKAKAALRLDSVEGILIGGDSGEPLFQAKQPEQSYLIQKITHKDPEERMPPEGPGITHSELKVIKDWIERGAALPDPENGANSFYETDHWAFQPIQRPAPPAVNNANTRIENPIDAFIESRLVKESLELSPEANRATLLRRLFLLTQGVPPTPEELSNFLNDQRETAYSMQVEAALASPRYGERWARHWLDVVRYADSNGFETNRERKTAWHYRDYVIDALNDDKPYDRFIEEQLAGDVLGADAATGFLVAGPFDIVKSPDITLTLMQRQNELDDMVNTTSTAFLGLTVGCARCHTHKFDPIHQKEYYKMQAVFAGVQHGERPLETQTPPGKRRSIQAIQSNLESINKEIEQWKKASQEISGDSKKTLRPPVSAKFNQEIFNTVEAKAIRFTILSSSSSEPCLDELEVYDQNDTNIALASEGAMASASGTLPGYAIHQLKHVNDGQTGNSHSWISNSSGTGWIEISFPQSQSVQRIVWSRDRSGQFNDRIPTRYIIEARSPQDEWLRIADSNDRASFQDKPDPLAFLDVLSKQDRSKVESILKQKENLQNKLKQLTQTETVWAGQFKQPGPTHRLYRGDPMQKRETTPPGALRVIKPLLMDENEPEQQRRLKLAKWITSDDNPLTARVMVNRIWHYIMGQGLVRTPSDFGANGVPPTHPTLLDWLADEFIKNDWSIKHIQRLILNSRTFKQSSKPTPEGMAKDAGGAWLWRFTPRRLSAEPMRDSILFTSGALDPKMGGPGFYLLDVQVENVMHYFPKENFGPAEFRRMVYQTRIRQEQDAIFGAFDCPDGNQVIPSRSRSNTPIQALNLFNSNFILQQSEIFASKLQTDFPASVDQQIHQAFLALHGKRPDDYEMQTSRALIQEDGHVAFCRALYNSSRFIFIF